jgi:hypothetical protein
MPKPAMEAYDELFSVRTDGCGSLFLFVNGQIAMQAKIEEVPWEQDLDQAVARTAQRMVKSYLNGDLMGPR